MRVVFIGASRFGLRCFERLLTISTCEVVGVVTNRERFSISYRPEGVRNVLYADVCPLAEEHGIPYYVMEGKMTEPAVLESVRSWSPEFILVAGWYHMVPRAIRTLAPTAGLHASLLPNYSGGAPLVWAIISGEQKAGMTFFMFEAGVDNGPIIGQKEEPIRLNDTIETLYRRIEEHGLDLIGEYLPKFATREGVALVVQDESKRRIMPQRRPEDGEISWSQSSWQTYNFIRAQTKPYPGAFSFCRGKRYWVWEAKLYDYKPLHEKIYAPGEIMMLVDSGPLNGLLVATGKDDHPLLLTQIGREEGASMPARHFVESRELAIGDVFGRSI